MRARTRYSHTSSVVFIINQCGAGAVPARELDVKGLHCPLPILRTRALLDRMEAGEELVVHATDPASVIDFKHFCNTTDNALLSHETQPDEVHKTVFIYRIRRGG